MNILLIPKGSDCYDKRGVCPNYETKEVQKNLITKAYCHLCKKTDEKLNYKEKICGNNL